MESSSDENYSDFNLTIEDELLSIDRLIEQANEFLDEFNAPSTANSTVIVDETVQVQDVSNDSIVNISESIQDAENQSTPRSAQSQVRQENLDQHGDDDVICLEVPNPTVVDFIDLCSPSPMSVMRATKRSGKAQRRFTAAATDTITEFKDKVTEEPQEKRAKEITCRICFESLFDRVTMSTSCGHMFCKICLDQVMKIQKKCPMCKQPLNRNRVFRIYL